MRESARQSVHMGSLVFAILLRWLSPWQAILFGCGAVAFNLWVLPHVGRALFRAHERPGRVSGGIMVYPIAVLLLVAIPGAALGRMDVAAGAWAIMAIGDGSATLAGRAFRGPLLPWSTHKTLAGSVTFAVSGAIAAAAFLWWTGGWTRWTPHPVPLLVAALCASVCASLVESLELPVDDNWTVPLTAAIVLLACAATSPALLAQRVTVGDVLLGLAVAGGLGLVSLALRSVGIGGLVGGVALGTLMWAVSGGWAFAALAAFFVLASIATRLGRRTKAARGLDEARGGRRGAAHAWANGGVALGCAAMSAGAGSALGEPLAVACAAALATSAADTVATEIGQWVGGPTLSLRTWRGVPPGTPGAVGVAGTLAGLGAAAVVGAVCVALHAIPARALPIIVCAAGAGSLVESMLHTRIAAARPTALVHHALNALNTLVGGVLALVWTCGSGR